METLRGPCPLIVSTTSSDHDTVGDDSRSLPTWRSAPRRSRDWRELSSALFGAVLHMARVTPRQMASEAKRIGPAGREPVDLLPPLLSDLFRPRRSLLSAYLPATRERPGRTETFALVEPSEACRKMSPPGGDLDETTGLTTDILLPTDIVLDRPIRQPAPRPVRRNDVRGRLRHRSRIVVCDGRIDRGFRLCNDRTHIKRATATDRARVTGAVRHRYRQMHAARSGGRIIRSRCPPARNRGGHHIDWVGRCSSERSTHPCHRCLVHTGNRCSHREGNTDCKRCNERHT
jgi:hypothetical protein